MITVRALRAQRRGEWDAVQISVGAFAPNRFILRSNAYIMLAETQKDSRDRILRIEQTPRLGEPDRHGVVMLASAAVPNPSIVPDALVGYVAVVGILVGFSGFFGFSAARRRRDRGGGRQDRPRSHRRRRLPVDRHLRRRPRRRSDRRLLRRSGRDGRGDVLDCTRPRIRAVLSDRLRRPRVLFRRVRPDDGGERPRVESPA